MITLTDEQIKSIAEDLQCGFNCFFNTKTGETKSLPDSLQHPMMDEEMWEDEFEEIDESEEDFIVFEGFDSRESFRIMEDFAYSVEDNNLKDSLLDILRMKKPFANFKWKIDNSGKYRQDWFDFRDQRYIESVKEQLARHNRQMSGEDYEELTDDE